MTAIELVRMASLLQERQLLVVSQRSPAPEARIPGAERIADE